jgi:hypothetical protein
MSQGPEQYSGRLTKAEEEHILTLTTPSEISAYMHELELAAGLRVRDFGVGANPTILHEIDREMLAAQQATPLTDVERAELERFRQAQPQPEAQPARNANGTFAKNEPTPSPVTAAANKIANTVVTDALAAEGISVEDLREFTAAKNADRAVVSTWAEATEAFKQGPGNEWPGGEENRTRLAYKLDELGLTDKPSVESLVAAWDSMKAEDELDRRLRKATSSDEIREITGAKERERQRVRAGNSF